MSFAHVLFTATPAAHRAFVSVCTAARFVGGDGGAETNAALVSLVFVFVIGIILSRIRRHRTRRDDAQVHRPVSVRGLEPVRSRLGEPVADFGDTCRRRRSRRHPPRAFVVFAPPKRFVTSTQHSSRPSFSHAPKRASTCLILFENSR